MPESAVAVNTQSDRGVWNVLPTLIFRQARGSSKPSSDDQNGEGASDGCDGSGSEGSGRGRRLSAAASLGGGALRGAEEVRRRQRQPRGRRAGLVRLSRDLPAAAGGGDDLQPHRGG